MPSFVSTAALIAGTIVAASAQFNINSKTNVATYWGQGPNQKRLVETCKSTSNDIVIIGFVNRFPDQLNSTYPGTNFGNACWGDVFDDANGNPTSLLKTCPNIEPDVIACQQTYGKKVLLSLGGGFPTDYRLNSDASGRSFADFLWKAWGPIQAGYTGPRPWGHAVVDGFDFDIESFISPAPADNPDYRTRGYAAMVNYLKNTLYAQDRSKPYYISGAPQCVIPDAHFAQVINRAWFDFLFIQFYNTPFCSARAGITKQANPSSSNDISYAQWTQQRSLNPNIKMYIGLPAAPAASGDNSFFLTLPEVRQTVQRFYSNARFGGIMLWESTYAQSQVTCNKDYAQWSKDILVAQAAGRSAVLTCPATTTSRTTTASRTTTSSSRVTTTSSTRPTTTSSRPTTTPVRTTTTVRTTTRATTTTTTAMRRGGARTTTTTVARRRRAQRSAAPQPRV